MEVYYMVYQGTPGVSKDSYEGDAVRFDDGTWALRRARYLGGYHDGWDLSVQVTEPVLPEPYMLVRLTSVPEGSPARDLWILLTARDKWGNYYDTVRDAAEAREAEVSGGLQ